MLEERYSGENSEAFWELVNFLDDDKLTLFEMGCKLQNLEGEVLKKINERESLVKRSLRSKPIFVKKPKKQ
jgi:hypothetical protein